LPYILYRGADGVHLVGLDGVSYLQAPTSDDRIGTGTNGFVSTNTQFSTVREGALLKFRALHDKKVKNPVAGTGLKIQDAFQSYMDSNFSDVLINTYYRTTHPDFANTHP
jgi:hypothetical protein